MPLAVSRSDGVTMLTLTSDSSSACPPLCQLLGALCYSPGLCSVTRRLPPQRGGPQAVLGALWILTALLHLGLGLILMNTRGAEVYVLRDSYCPVWLGVLFLFFGVICILSERFPKPIVVLLNGLLNLSAVALSITAIVYYSIDIDVSGPGFYSFCQRDPFGYGWYRHRYTTTIEPTDPGLLQERCEEARALLRGLTTSLRSILIILSVLDLSLGISTSVFSFKALRQGLRASGNKERLEEAEKTSQEEFSTKEKEKE